MFSSNQLRFCSQKRWKLLSTIPLKKCKYIEKNVVRHIYDDLFFFFWCVWWRIDVFDKYLSWLLFSVLLTHKYAYKVWNVCSERVKSYFLNLFIINQNPDEVSHLSFKQKRHRVFLNYLYNFKSQNNSHNFFIFFTSLNTN